MNPRTKRRCPYCNAHDVWDRARYLDASGNETTYPARVTVMESVTCLSCKQLLPLGPSDESDHAEIEAARIIADVETNVEHITDWQIAIGMAAYDADNDPPTGGLAWMWHAGWLARHIFRDSHPSKDPQ